MHFWKENLSPEYQRWWMPKGLPPPKIQQEKFSFPTHITYNYQEQSSTSTQRCYPIENCPDPPHDPYHVNKKKRKRSEKLGKSKKSIPENHILCSKKILLRPNKEQKKVFKTWFSASRHVFNWALGVCKRNRYYDKNMTNRFQLKNMFVTCKTSRIPKKLGWLRDVPYTIKESATCRLAKSFSDRRDDAKNLQKPFSYPKFMCKGKSETTVTIDTQNFSKKKGDKWKFYITSFPQCPSLHSWMRKKDRLWMETEFPNGPIREVKISMTTLDSFYMIVPFYKSKKAQVSYAKSHLVAFDPGSNPFMTYYSPTRQVTGSYGTEKDVMIFRKHQGEIDKIKSVISTLKKELSKFDRKKMRKIKRLIRKGKYINRKAHNLAMDAIHKIVNKVSMEYQYVHTSPFNTKNMMKKNQVSSTGEKRKRRIRKQTVRDLQGWLHYRFKQVLLHKEAMTTGMKVEILSEYLTTKSCDKCGELKENIGGNKIFKCSNIQCGHIVNRDVHGARNHALRNCVGRYTLI